MCFVSVLPAQHRTLEYEIHRKNDVVGTLHVTESIYTDKTIYQLSSKVQTQFLFKFTSLVEEESVFIAGTLYTSSVFRKLNGKEKLNKKTRQVNNNYEITQGNKTERLDLQPIYYNFHSIYAREPLTVPTVYSDNYQRHLSILKLGDQHYKVQLPDGSWNEYFYRDGVCVEVRIHHSLYNAQLKLRAPHLQ